MNAAKVHLRRRGWPVPRGSARRTAEVRLHTRLRGLLPRRRGARVGVYAPLPDEPDLRPLYRELVRRGAHLVVPLRTTAGRWLWGEPTDVDAWLAAADPWASSSIRPSAPPEAAVVPGLLFDRDGYRLGRGGGTYDRLLVAVPWRIGVAWPGRRVARLPRDSWDVPMDVVLVPTGLGDLVRSGSRYRRRGARWTAR